jgi:hypothetical protein
MGISSFAYLAGGNEHEVVNPSGPGVLYLPRLIIMGGSTEVIAPYYFGVLTNIFTGKAFTSLEISGYLSNQALGQMPLFPFTTRYGIYEDGDIYLRTEISIAVSCPYDILFEEHILNPKADPDITIAADSSQSLKFGGFYSNNTGDDPSDISADGILMQFQDYFDLCVFYTYDGMNAVGLGTASGLWYPGMIITRYFRLHLSVQGSPHDVTDAGTFQSTGDDKAFDHRIPDPLTGGQNEGTVITGALDGDGYNEEEGAYTVIGVS